MTSQCDFDTKIIYSESMGLYYFYLEMSLFDNDKCDFFFLRPAFFDIPLRFFNCFIYGQVETFKNFTFACNKSL